MNHFCTVVYSKVHLHLNIHMKIVDGAGQP